jgi:hypothetical protein
MTVGSVIHFDSPFSKFDRPLAPTLIAMLSYSDLGYQNLRLDGYVMASSREDLVQRILHLWNEGRVCILLVTPTVPC